MTKSVLLDPHGDDSVLFACWHLLREKPHVIVVLRSVVQEQRGGPTAAVREAETAAAMEILGCTWEQWTEGDGDPKWRDLEPLLADVATDFDHCYAPAYEHDGGNTQHNVISAQALAAFGAERVTNFLTYTTAGKSEWGTRVPYEPEWVPLKLAALACYRSQAGLANCAEHFLRGLHEYVA